MGLECLQTERVRLKHLCKLHQGTKPNFTTSNGLAANMTVQTCLFGVTQVINVHTLHVP